MNVFRLVLCLAGLTIYLVVKQYLLSSPVSQLPQRPRPALPPAPEVQHRQAVPCSPRPQTQPHIEVLKPETTYVDAGGH